MGNCGPSLCTERAWSLPTVGKHTTLDPCLSLRPVGFLEGIRPKRIPPQMTNRPTKFPEGPKNPSPLNRPACLSLSAPALLIPLSRSPNTLTSHPPNPNTLGRSCLPASVHTGLPARTVLPSLPLSVPVDTPAKPNAAGRLGRLPAVSAPAQPRDPRDRDWAAACLARQHPGASGSLALGWAHLPPACQAPGAKASRGSSPVRGGEGRHRKEQMPGCVHGDPGRGGFVTWSGGGGGGRGNPASSGQL